MTCAILAVDPGGTTGLADIRYRPDSAPWIMTAVNVDYGPIEMFEAVTRWAEESANCERRVIVYETWVPLATEFSADPNHSCQLIGALRVAAHLAHIEVFGQTAKMRTSVTNEVLKASPYWVQGKRDDHRQAIRHGLTWLINHGHRPTTLVLHPRP